MIKNLDMFTNEILAIVGFAVKSPVSKDKVVSVCGPWIEIVHEISLIVWSY